MSWRIHQGDWIEVLRTLPDESVHCVVTSPPYWGLRDYGVPGQLGLEKTPEEYVAKMVEGFREVRRVLRSDGTCWINLGDSYFGSWGNYGGQNRGNGSQRAIDNGSQVPNPAYNGLEQYRPPTAGKIDGLKPKDLCGIPWMVAFALRSDGWYLRSDIIWAKPNPMPESVTDRPTKAHEYLFLMSKSERYFYDADAIKEKASYGWNGSSFDDERDLTLYPNIGKKPRPQAKRGDVQGRPVDTGFRNKRSVWSVPTQAFSGWTETSRQVRVELDAATDDSEHITSPDCPLHGDSSASASSAFCGGRAVRDQNRTARSDGRRAQGPQAESVPTDRTDDADSLDGSLDSVLQPSAPLATHHNNQTRRTGHDLVTIRPCTASAQTLCDTERTSEGLVPYGSAGRTNESSTSADFSLSASSLSERTEQNNADRCTCKYYNTITEEISHFATFPPKLVEPCILAGCPIDGTVLDPFSGAGTTGLVATRLGRNFVGIELNPEYIAMSERRITQDAPLFNTVEASR